MTADACERRVVAGPVEATALGNVLVQAIATGYLPDIAAGRQAIAASVDLATFVSHPALDWDAAFARFTALVQAS
jgi:rhamnulokinase